MSESGRPFRPETTVAIGAVKRGLTISRRCLGAAEVTAKGERDLVTDTDVAVEEAVRRIVGDGSGLAVIGEERGGEASADCSPY
jgi:fructose-1,6-bisphosphatase/inositol monophosphatase family enzyme